MHVLLSRAAVPSQTLYFIRALKDITSERSDKSEEKTPDGLMQICLTFGSLPLAGV